MFIEHCGHCTKQYSIFLPFKDASNFVYRTIVIDKIESLSGQGKDMTLEEKQSVQSYLLKLVNVPGFSKEERSEMLHSIKLFMTNS